MADSSDDRTRLASRRDILKAAPVALAALAAHDLDAATQAAPQAATPAARPNIVVIMSDQFRWDCVGAAGLNPMGLTPNLDAMAARGTMFANAICAQPVCAPTRGSLLTGQYPSRHGVWRNGIALPPGATTLATVLRQAGYTANHIGKWHLAGDGGTGREVMGPVPAEYRGGFLDLWQSSNVLEMTSHPYEGDLYDADGRPMHFSGVYRTDFMTDLAQKFLRQARSPFLLTLSYLEVHHQNDADAFVPPKEYAGRYRNPFVPPDLRPLPGSWPSQLGDYFACVAKMDETVGTIRKTLADTGLDRTTIVLFVSDHGCHFKTRNTEYKRSPHESSIHVPLIVEGPGFNRGGVVPEIVSHVDLAPSLIAACGLEVPASMQGRSVLPLVERKTDGWRNEAYFEMSEFVTGRGLRTPQFTYAAMTPKVQGWRAVNGADRYVEYMLYDNLADPHQHVNLAGRATYARQAADLRARLASRILEASGTPASIDPCQFPYS
jgi:arylsulfatase A-like enzyme